MRKRLLLLVWLGLFGLSAFGFKNATVAPPFKIKKVVIDPGHGGKDAGCSGKHSKEKHITLEIALKVGAYIEDNIPNVEVIYTRTTDKYITLSERAAIANRNDADLFVSIHCNAQAGGTSAYGTETYVMGLHRSDENLAVAKRENSVITMEDNYLETYDGFDPNAPETHIIFNLYTESNLKESTHLANLIEEQFATRAGRKSRGVKQAGLVVLYKSAMPAVLVESGFLSNLSEEQFLKNDEGQSYIASAVYRAIKQYKQEVEFESNSAVLSPISDSNTPPVSGGGRLGGVVSGGQTRSNPIETTQPPEIARRYVKGAKYRVQLYDSNHVVDLSKADLKSVGSFEIDILDDGTKCYLAGMEFDRYGEADKQAQQMRKAGFPGAVVIEYQEGLRVKK